MVYKNVDKDIKTHSSQYMFPRFKPINNPYKDIYKLITAITRKNEAFCLLSLKKFEIPARTGQVVIKSSKTQFVEHCKRLRLHFLGL